METSLKNIWIRWMNDNETHDISNGSVKALPHAIHNIAILKRNSQLKKRLNFFLTTNTRSNNRQRESKNKNRRSVAAAKVGTRADLLSKFSGQNLTSPGGRVDFALKILPRRPRAYIAPASRPLPQTFKSYILFKYIFIIYNLLI